MVEKIILKAKTYFDDYVVLSTANRNRFKLETRCLCIPEFFAEMTLTSAMIKELGEYLADDSRIGKWHTIFYDGFSVSQSKLTCLTQICDDERELLLSYNCVDDDLEYLPSTVCFCDQERIRLIEFCQLMQQPVSLPVEPPVFGLCLQAR